MAGRRQAIIEELEAALAASVDFFGSLAPAELDTRVYAGEGGWTARQVLAHFLTIERSMQWLFRDILAGGPGSPPEFDLERYNTRQVQKLDAVPAAELIERFKAVRRQTVAIVAGMAEADLDRQGEHAFHGHGRLERFLRWVAEHNRLHEADIRRALGGENPAPVNSGRT